MNLGSTTTSSSSAVLTNISFDSGWNQIQEEAINPLEDFLSKQEYSVKICKPIFTAQQYSRIYTLIYNMCTQKSPRNWSCKLYGKYCETIDKYLREKILPRLQGCPGPELLRGITAAWENHYVYIHWMERFFGYLNRYHVKLCGEGSLEAKGMVIFYESLFSHLKDDIAVAFGEAIENDRSGIKLVSDQVLQGVVNLCSELGRKGNIPEVYENDIEGILLTALTKHYCSKVEEWLEKDTMWRYLQRVDCVFNDEEERCNRCLDEVTILKFRRTLIQILLSNPLKKLLEKDTGVHYMLVNKKYDQLNLAYKLFSMINDGIITLSNYFKLYILECGQDVIDFYKTFQNNIGNSINTMNKLTIPNCPWIDGEIVCPLTSITVELQCIQTMLYLYDYSQSISLKCFQQDPQIQKAIKEAFEIIINRDIGTYSQVQLICNYCDRLNKKGGIQNKYTQTYIQELIRKLIELFSYIHDQDYFLEIYKLQLAKRLLLNNVQSEENELLFISLLKNKCGPSFTIKLEGMLHDMQLALDLNKRYKSYQDEMKVLNPQAMEHKIFPLMDFSVNVLTISTWPSLMVSDLELPEEMQQYTRHFEEFYHKETTHRKIVWVHGYGQCIILGTWCPDDGNYEFHCNTFQACILLLFNHYKELSFSQIQSLLKVDETILRKHIASLTKPDIKILKQSFKDTSETETEYYFQIDNDFTSQNRKIRLPFPVQEEFTFKTRIEEDRSHTIEAAIVRIMKNKREISHSELVNEVTNQLKSFKPNAKYLKNRIDYLIEREYIARHQENPLIYIYI
ncbi:cullin family protein [Cryptosporidium muris RN66]|uniref:Cullin family protein n=1 Tax=Cryptosporidium muris (strain RN66) TaxID=441375 RepID=B6AD65_CRYMR|nr:cullin family protein [Cryptosporidium muris RN66]EEA06069.1 cullin family protein [Cryptosporidium muris RN66]|eukprot:XP_002140418.1 cullin family protein [Cryptosporidium muris RN66]